MGYYDDPQSAGVPPCPWCGVDYEDTGFECEDPGYCRLSQNVQDACEAFDYACEEFHRAEVDGNMFDVEKAQRERAMAREARTRAWIALTTYEIALMEGGHTVPGEDE